MVLIVKSGWWSTQAIPYIPEFCKTTCHATGCPRNQNEEITVLWRPRMRRICGAFAAYLRRKDVDTD